MMDFDELKGLRGKPGTLWEYRGVTYLTEESDDGCLKCSLTIQECLAIKDKLQCLAGTTLVYMTERDVSACVNYNTVEKYINEDGEEIVWPVMK